MLLVGHVASVKILEIIRKTALAAIVNSALYLQHNLSGFEQVSELAATFGFSDDQQACPYNIMLSSKGLSNPSVLWIM